MADHRAMVLVLSLDELLVPGVDPGMSLLLDLAAQLRRKRRHVHEGWVERLGGGNAATAAFFRIPGLPRVVFGMRIPRSSALSKCRRSV